MSIVGVGDLRYDDRDPITTITATTRKNNAEQNNLPLFKSEI